MTLPHFSATMFLACCITVISFPSVHAQIADSAFRTPYFLVSLRKTENKDFIFRPFILPSLMIVYGCTSLRSDGLKDINESIQEELWQDKPHKRLSIDNYMQFFPAAGVYVLNLAGIVGKHNFRDRSMIYLMANAFVNSSVFIIKKVSREQRPDASAYNSFPSGHTAEAFASAEFLRQEYKDFSPWFGIAGYAVATATGVLRMYNNKHWLSDVVSGAGTGLISTKLAYWLYPAVSRKLFHGRPETTVLIPGYENGVAGISLLHQFH